MEISKILIVDDLPANLLALRKLLKKVNCQVVEALSGNEALTLCLDHEFALILLDVNMPEMDGYEVAELLSQDQKTKETPIILVTANYTTSENQIKGYKVGALDYIQKPINDEILLAKVQVFLKLENQKRELNDTLNALNEASNHNKLVFNSAHDAILSVDEQCNIVLANPAANSMLHIYDGSLLDKPLSSIFSFESEDSHASWQETSIAKSMQSDNPFPIRETNLELLRQDGTSFPVEMSYAPYTRECDSTTTSISSGVVTFRDISEIKGHEQELMRLAREDPLTHLPNRLMFNERLEEALNNCMRHNDGMALFYLDMDHFKQINDTLGHDTGDKLLLSVTQRMRDCLRQSDMIARLGGDEFAVLMPRINNVTEITRVAEKMIQQMGAPHMLNGHSTLITFSIGIVTFPEAGNTTEQIMKAADTAMYHAKSKGRNNYQFFEPEMQRRAIFRSELEDSLKTAVRNEEFICHFQPKVWASDYSSNGLEAVVRWKSKERGMVSPVDFIPMAEEIGLILPIGEQVLNLACQTFQDWRDSNIVLPEQHIAVNISIQQLRQGHFISTVKRILEKTQISPHQLTLEITESTVMDNPHQAIEILQELKDMGISTAVDDFGTGYSSLMYLKHLPISTLKIDRAFVRDIGRDKNDEAIVRATINLAHTLSLTVTAEGVETERQAEFLTRNECDHLQGFYFAPPLPEIEASEWLQQQEINHPAKDANQTKEDRPNT